MRRPSVSAQAQISLMNGTHVGFVEIIFVIFGVFRCYPVALYGKKRWKRRKRSCCLRSPPHRRSTSCNVGRSAATAPMSWAGTGLVATTNNKNHRVHGLSADHLLNVHRHDQDPCLRRCQCAATARRQQFVATVAPRAGCAAREQPSTCVDSLTSVLR